jgi:17beta-estradiol 17-dehydrogenase/3beta-hydroxysteroid 3-dehydrogenase/mitotic-spindle organizing protein 1
LQCDTTLKIAFKEKTNLVDFYGSLPSENYKELKRFAEQMITMFGNTYICEQTFSILNYRKNKHCSRLSDSHLDPIRRLSTTKMHANANEKNLQVKCNDKYPIDCINYNKFRKNIH